MLLICFMFIKDNVTRKINVFNIFLVARLSFVVKDAKIV